LASVFFPLTKTVLKTDLESPFFNNIMTDLARAAASFKSAAFDRVGVTDPNTAIRKCIDEVVSLAIIFLIESNDLLALGFRVDDYYYDANELESLAVLEMI
jgi:hypothetical protein